MRNLKLKTGWLIISLAVLILASPTGLADPNEPKKSTVGPIPPPEVVERRAAKALLMAPMGDQHELSVPGYLWRHGCAPSSTGMVVGYYDSRCYQDLISGEPFTQTEAVNQAIASGGSLGNPYNPEQHYEDYSTPEDPPPGPVVQDDYITEGRQPHSDNCIADFMFTSRSNRLTGLNYGGTWDFDVGPAFNSYVNMRNSLYNPSYQFYSYSAGLWNILVTELDDGRPMIFGVDSSGDGNPDHAVAVVGYDDTLMEYGFLDTWPPAGEVQWESFGPLGQAWGIDSGYSFHLDKWVQAPRENPNGMDIRCDRVGGLPRRLADDFECVEAGPITKVSLWASWKDDTKGEIKKIYLSIHEDIPADDPCNPYDYSIPGAELWSEDFLLSEFDETMYIDLGADYEWWWDVAGLQDPDASGDHQIWRYDIRIDKHKAFFQEGTAWNPIIYWLSVRVEQDLCYPSTSYTSGWSKAEFGWKTSKIQWGDDAVWSNNNGRTWNELRYPSGHPEESNSIDLAFRIITDNENDVDFGDCPDPTYPTLLGSDGARHIINGTVYLGSEIDSEPDGQQDSSACGDDNDGTNDDDGVTFVSQLIRGFTATVEVDASVCGQLDAWIDFNGDGDWADAGEQIFANKSLNAGVNRLTFNVPANAAAGVKTYARFRFSTAGGLSYTGQAADGEVEDYAVNIEPAAKWIQLPDTSTTGIDIRCDRRDGTERLLADDFECRETEPITNVILWGSWKNDIKGEIEYIHLSIHDDIPDPDPCGPYYFSKPNDPPLWERDFWPEEFTETLYFELTGYEEWEWWWDPHKHLPPVWNGDKQIWMYEISIDPCDAFIQQGDPCNPVIYWLDVYVQLMPDSNNPRFGWKTSRDHWNDDAVWYEYDDLMMEYYWSELRYPTGHPNHPDSIDMAFAINAAPAETENIKWSQPPVPWPTDPNNFFVGWDEVSHNMIPVMVADDFLCDSNEPVTTIRWWGSLFDWFSKCTEVNETELPDAFYITIWNDVPADADPCYPYSHPGEIIWDNYCDSYTMRYYGKERDPQGGPFLAKFEFYQELDVEDYWYQPGDSQIYWLGIMAIYDSEPNYPWGWETREHFFMDDAVRFFGFPQPGQVYEPNEFYPIEFDSNSWDLSFELISNPVVSRLTTKHLKWSQPPIKIDPLASTPTYCGWDELSYKENDLESELWHMVADDFRCLGTMPITSVHWWGSYFDWIIGVPPANEPNDWRIGFWSNVADTSSADPNTYSYPEKLLWRVDVPIDRVVQSWVGSDQSPIPLGPEDTCFEYHVDLEQDEIFWQANFDSNTEGNIFWISITAMYPNDVNATNLGHPWGWKSRPWHWMDDAVMFDSLNEPNLGMVLEPNNITPIEIDINGVTESWDMAFQLDTDPDWIKWEQAFTGLVNWSHYEDVPSCISVWPDGNDIWQVAADDWRCEQRTPVTAIVWWGSYICDSYEACTGCHTLPSNNNRPDYFLISVWTDMSADDPCNGYQYSRPGQKIWEYKALEYDEVLVGYDKRPHDEPNEAVFRYSVRLPQQNWFRQPDVNDIYWLSIVAVYMGRYPDCAWGWTNHPHVFQDDAVSGSTGFVPSCPNEWQWYELYDQTGVSEDLSFMLFTDPKECSDCADYNGDGIVNFRDYADFADDWHWTGPCGGVNKSDLNCDGFADFKDLRIFALQWLKSCP